MQIPYRKPGKFSQIPQDPLLTQKKVNELERQLDRLKRIRPQAAADVARLAELGDFSENVEYQLAKGRLRGINSGILKLEHQMNHAVIITPATQSDTVEIGHTVTVEQDAIQKAYQILGSSETDPSRGIISHTSPIGAALLGHKTGDIVTIPIRGKKVSYRIIRIA